MEVCPDFRIATLQDAGRVTKIWKAAAQRCRDMGQPLWDPDSFSEESTCALMERGTKVVVESGSSAIVATLDVLDPLFWPDRLSTLEAFYLHRIAVDPSRRGEGLVAQLFTWIEALALGERRSFLRLDCAPRPKLMAVYERCGFKRMDPLPVHMGGFDVVRFERAL